ncbi:HlyD family type I secretion periplasmic adaptor subunit [Sphingorhabdus sp.]|uniref:HlyD family type I secretion periplasmic adaptor subunit n=1 Tax=Sphingorhabdus sp. TaxID=1902408 RepID=UPI00391A8DAB
MIERWFPNFVRHWAVFKESWKQHNRSEADAKPMSDHEFLPAALEIMEKPPSPGLRWLLLSVCGLFTLALVWSIIGRVDVVATANGKVIPSGNVKIIQPIEIGYVRKIHVHNGQHVEAGQLLVELDPTLAGADAAQANQKLLTSQVIAARNMALLDHLNKGGSRFTAPAGASAETASTQTDFVQSSIVEYEAERTSLIQQRAERAADLAGSEAEISKLKQTLPLMEMQLVARKELAEKGYFSKIRLLEFEQQKVEHIQNIAVQVANASKARAAMANIDAQLLRLKGSFRKNAVAELSGAQETIALSREDVTKSARRQEFQQLRAPVSGTVQQLAISTIGGVVQPAQTLMIIVPDDAAVVVEASIMNKDIGFVREGQPVRVKLEAFNFTDYGIIPGVVDSISRDAIETSQQNLDRPQIEAGRPPSGQGPVYAARIRLLKRTISVRGDDRVIGPGLAAQIEIKTGERRIIQYLLSPLSQTIDEAGRER